MSVQKTSIILPKAVGCVAAYALFFHRHNVGVPQLNRDCSQG